jgi:hypothetical protein
MDGGALGNFHSRKSLFGESEIGSPLLKMVGNQEVDMKEDERS